MSTSELSCLKAERRSIETFEKCFLSISEQNPPSMTMAADKSTEHTFWSFSTKAPTVWLQTDVWCNILQHIVNITAGYELTAIVANFSWWNIFDLWACLVEVMKFWNKARPSGNRLNFPVHFKVLTLTFPAVPFYYWTHYNSAIWWHRSAES